MKKSVLYLSAGHGGFNGQYHCLANGKQFNHKGENFHCDGNFYEGVSNRQLSTLLIKKIKDSGLPIIVIPVYDEIQDWRLSHRTDMANFRYSLYKGFNQLYLDLHSNASKNHNVSGMEGYTLNKGCEPFVQKYLKDVSKVLKVRNRGLKTANFHSLTATLMPSILLENLFFDFLHDAKLLISPMVQELIAEYMFRMIVNYFNSQNL